MSLRTIRTLEQQPEALSPMHVRTRLVGEPIGEQSDNGG